MQPDEAYQMYVSLKLHFSSMTYNYFKFKGKRKHQLNYQERNDRFLFEKLARRKDVFGRLVANLSFDPNMHVSVLVGSQGDKIYYDWKKRQESFTYMMRDEFAKVKPIFPDGFKTAGGQHPLAFKLYLKKEISIDAMAIINSYTGILKAWNENLKDDPVWVSMRVPLLKYGEFQNYDRESMGKILKDELL